jgi:RHS repeat-associated protein
LEVNASDVGLEGSTISGIAFTLYGGTAQWDHAGKKSSTGAETVWVDDDLPTGAVPSEPFTWAASGPQASFAYTGHYFHSPSNLHLAHYREFNGELGRWISRDPLSGAEIVEGANLYRYVRNNPLSSIDPSGRGTIGIGVQGGGGALGHIGLSGGFFVGKTGLNPFTGWSCGFLGALALGVEGGATIGGGGFVQVTTAPTVETLKGPGFDIGASGGPVLARGGIDVIGSLGYVGCSFNGNLGASTPLEVHGDYTDTGGWTWGKK